MPLVMMADDGEWLNRLDSALERRSQMIAYKQQHIEQLRASLLSARAPREQLQYCFSLAFR